MDKGAVTQNRWGAGFVERIGGMLVAPRQTLDGILRGQKGGVRDLVWLLLLQVVTVQLPQLVMAILVMVRQSYSAGMTMLVNTMAASAWMPLAAAILGAVVIGPFVRRRVGNERSLDVCALCAVPAVELQLAASLLTGLTSLQPRRWLAITVLAAGGLWFLLLVLIGARMIRETPMEQQ